MGIAVLQYGAWPFARNFLDHVQPLDPLAQSVEHLTFNQGVPRSSRGWVTNQVQRRTLAIEMVAGVLFAFQGFLDLVEGHANLAVLVVEEDQHLVVVECFIQRIEQA